MSDVPQYVPKLTCTKISTSAVTYHLSTGKPLGGWVLATVNDETGELQIMSDWGSWSHRWNTDHLGSPSLTHFIGDRAGVHYLADKLTSRDEAHQFDPDATVKNLRARILELRRDWRTSHLTAREARDLWDEMGGDLRDCTSFELFVERFYRIDGSNFVSERIWEDEAVVFKPSTGYMVLLHGILPALAQACAQRVRAVAS